jgi:hypothetical protein
MDLHADARTTSRVGVNESCYNVVKSINPEAAVLP